MWVFNMKLKYTFYTYFESRQINFLHNIEYIQSFKQNRNDKENFNLLKPKG